MVTPASAGDAPGFVPPPYPYDRLGALARLADAAPGGVVDCSVGSPVDPVPEVAVRAAVDSLGLASGYPPSIGTPGLRAAAAAWLERRFAVVVEPAHVIACIGTKELVASLARLLHLRDPSRDTVLYPAVSYPTYAMSAQLAGLRAVPVPLDDDWHLALDRVSEADAARSLVLWRNDPGNPTASVSGSERARADVAWARDRGVLVAGDECYAEFPGDARFGSVLGAGSDGVVALHSLSKRSNMAGYRVGFAAGDPAVVAFLAEVRKHAGMMVPAPVQAAAAAALADDAHVDVQRDRYARRRTVMLDAFAAVGLAHDGGPSPFYLWLREESGPDDGWEIAARLAEAGVLVAPGDLYGPAGADHVRVAMTQTDERIALAAERLATWASE